MTLHDNWIIIRSLLTFGLPETLRLVAASLVLTLIFGILFGTLRYLKIPVVDNILWLYGLICRGIPLIVVMFFVFADGVGGGPYWSAVIALTFAEAGYIMEIVKGALASVDQDQVRAGEALALSRWFIVWRVVAPQASIAAMPAIIGQLILLVKGTAVASVIGFTELTRNGQELLTTFSNAVLIYLYVLGFYFLLCRGLTVFSNFLHHKLTRYAIGVTP